MKLQVDRKWTNSVLVLCVSAKVPEVLCVSAKVPEVLCVSAEVPEVLCVSAKVPEVLCVSFFFNLEVFIKE